MSSYFEYLFDFQKAMSLSKILKYSNNVHSKVICIGSYESSLGQIIAAADEDFLYIVSFENSINIEKKFQRLSEEVPSRFVKDNNDILKKFENELALYFEGSLKKFTLQTKPMGSEFQKEVWNKLQDLPYASKKTYSDLAKALSLPGSYARAIGNACGANPLLLVVPCHRIIASASQGGFSCGTDRKAWLIEHETKYAI